MIFASDTLITISWKAPNYNGGNSITNYAVYKSINTNSQDHELHERTSSAAVVTMTLGEVVRGATYYFKVTASNQIGEGGYSAEISVLAATIPLRPNVPSIAA